ncbi:MAG: hypothetical protein ABFC88_01060 [Thermoguttaceae bacterium]
MKKHVSRTAGFALVLLFACYALYSRDGAVAPSLTSPVYAAQAGTGCLDFSSLPAGGPVGGIAFARAKVPGGWLVIADYNGESGSSHRGVTMVFYPDQQHEWKGR